MSGPSESAPSIALARAPGEWRAGVERWLEVERDQLALWLPVALGVGIAAWFGLDDARGWRAFLAVSGAVGAVALVIDRRGRAGRALAWFALAACLGCGLAWARSAQVAAPVLARPVVAEIGGRIATVEPLPAREAVRLTIDLTDPGRLPPRVRINIDDAAAPAGLAAGARVAVKARLVPPPPPAVPGAYDFARVAWFMGLGRRARRWARCGSSRPPRPGVARRCGWNASARP